MEMMTFTVPARPPFRLDLTVWALRRRPDNAIDRWDGRTYRRVLVLQGRPLEIEVVQIGEPDRAELQVTATGTGLGPDTEPCLRPLLSSLLGLQVDLEPFYRLAATDARLSALADRLLGLKPPRFPTLFEALINAIACQQITLTLGIRLLNRLAERYGPAVPRGGGQAHDGQAHDGQAHDGQVHGFPRPCDLAAADSDALRSLGFLGRWLGQPVALDYVGVHRAVAPWQSYAGLVYLHLLIDKLAALGQVVP